MGTGALTGWVLATLLVGLRVAPVFALAPPFSLTRVPTPLRVMFGLGISACLVSAHPSAILIGEAGLHDLVVAALRELLLGAIVVLAFQLMFAALYVAGRTIDIQAGFGLAMLIDPTTRAQTPLVGTLFAYGAAAVFFAMDGPAELLRLMGASLEAIPLGSAGPPLSLARLAEFISAVFVTGFGIGGGAILCLFLADLAIATLARTVPQMNVLVLGFQVKTILLLVVLPLAFGASGALFARLTRLTLEAIPRLL